MKVVDRDRGAQGLMLRLRRAGMKISAGVVGETANTPHSGSDLTVGEIASIHELGLGSPRRSFVRDPIDQKARRVQSRISSELVAVAKGKNPKAAADAIGNEMADVMREAIDEGVGPALKEETSTRKGHSKQLVETRQLRGAITHQAELRSGRR